MKTRQQMAQSKFERRIVGESSWEPVSSDRALEVLGDAYVSVNLLDETLGTEEGVRTPYSDYRYARYSHQGSMSFVEALAAFVQILQALQAKHYEKFPSLRAPRITTMVGPKFVRIVLEQDRGQRSVHSFVRREDGAILKAAGWKAPFIAAGGANASATVRGNIYGDLSGVTFSGVAYLK